MSRERLARDVFDTFATHAGLIYDVTDTDRRAQYGKKCCMHFFFILFFIHLSFVPLLSIGPVKFFRFDAPLRSLLK